MGERRVATIVPGKEDKVSPAIGADTVGFGDLPSKAPRKTALQRPARTQARSVLDTLLCEVNSGGDGGTLDSSSAAL